ncbi:hypothetical protein BD626DRAFT_547830 [Schizophyllum amplum]|uniref:Uncharacterized protein n=1 Tax=Schizophyllum amplum TaxID=97359 RepID=A0A550CH32_9AGAR|nr:hypothetical protein BD626DRAFT_547830 [Auriculariopsis ampla]
MSLPPAPKDISSKPKAGAVTDPVNKADKDADVDRKIRFYGVIAAFREGRMPSNSQIDHTLKYVLDNSPVPTGDLSPEGKRLIQDTQDIIATARKIVQEKNSDELLQTSSGTTNIPVGKDKAKNDGRQAVQHLRTLITLVLTNAEARKLLSDFGVMGRDLLARGASKAADNLAPHPDRLAAVDESAPKDQFVSKDGKHVGPDETPVLEARVPGTDHKVERHPRDDNTVVRDSDGRPVATGQEAFEERKNDALRMKDQAAERARAEAGDVQQQGAYTDDSTEEAKAKKNGMMDKIRGLRDDLTNRVPQEHKDNAREKYERSQQFLSDEYFPPERRDQFIFRMKKVVIECQKHDDYQESLTWLLDVITEYFEHGQNVSGQHKENVKSATGDQGLQQAWSELRTLLERFANGQSMNGIFDSIERLADDARRDQELRQWLEDTGRYTRKTLLEPGFILEPQCNNEANRLRETGRQFYDGKYKNHFDGVFTAFANFGRAMGDDRLNARFGQDWARLTKDLLFDSEGRLAFKPELWNDIRRTILPSIVDKVGYVPLPRIEYTDDSFDLVVENLVLSGRNTFPNIVEFEAKNFVKFSPYNSIKDDQRHEFTLTLSQIQADMRDVAFYFRKKTGMPKISDSGLADVVLGGEGVTATVHLSNTKDTSSVFKVKNVKVNVDSLKFSIRDSKHDLLYKTLKPLATGLVKKQIEKALKDAITTGMEYVDGQLVGVRDRMEAAKQSDEQSRRDVLMQLFQSKKDEASTKTKETDAQFKFATNKRSSLLPDKGHPSSIVNRTSEREEAAKHGKDWRSDAFTIV